jgi:hypothetical protein
MTIKLEYNISKIITLYLLNPQTETYLLQCTYPSNEIFSTTIENLSNSLDQYSLFNIVSIQTNTGTSNNVIYLPYRGEYDYKIYNENNKLVGSGILINTYNDNLIIDYDQNENKIIYNG